MSEKVYNPFTKREVKVDGAIGKRIKDGSLFKDKAYILKQRNILLDLIDPDLEMNKDIKLALIAKDIQTNRKNAGEIKSEREIQVMDLGISFVTSIILKIGF